MLKFEDLKKYEGDVVLIKNADDDIIAWGGLTWVSDVELIQVVGDERIPCRAIAMNEDVNEVYFINESCSIYAREA